MMFRNGQNMVFGSVVAIMLATAVAWAQNDQQQQMQVVDKVDLQKYMGRFYEIASIPTWFQEDCAGGTTADYKLNDNGDVDVVNSCYTAEGELDQADGVAWVVDPRTNAKLKVSFFPFGLKWFGGDYWIIALGDDYEYSVVGHPSREYGWILSRTPTLPAEKLEKITKKIKEAGYDFSRFKFTDQSRYIKKDVPPAEQ